MAFDWLTFLQRHNIPHTTRAHNLTRGNIGTYCPLCDWPDKLDPESWRLGISPAGKGWSCWSNADHRGIRPHRLVQAFLKCTWAEAIAICGSDAPAVPGGSERSFGDMIGSMLFGSKEEARKPPGKLEFPESVPPLRLGRVEHTACHRYLQTRGYSGAESDDIIKRYGLRFALSGYFRYRVLFPVEHPGEGLVSWQSRTTLKHEALRYLALSAEPEKAKKHNLPLARYNIRDTLWNARAAFEEPRKKLFVCEGPFDALRIDYYGRTHAHAVGLFGKFVSDAQFTLLADIAPLYDDCVLLLDPDAALDASRIVDKLDVLHFRTARLPPKRKDPAELSYAEVQTLVRA